MIFSENNFTPRSKKQLSSEVNAVVSHVSNQNIQWIAHKKQIMQELPAMECFSLQSWNRDKLRVSYCDNKIVHHLKTPNNQRGPKKCPRGPRHACFRPLV